jgi:hypothetical protein
MATGFSPETGAGGGGFCASSAAQTSGAVAAAMAEIVEIRT